MNTLIIFCASYLIYIVALAGLIFLVCSRKRARIALYAVVVLPVTYVAGTLAGFLWYDPRPFTESGTAPLIAHAADNGFPSDHLLLGGAIASVVFAYNRPLGILLWVLVIIVGAARVLAGVHHVADIVGGAVIAAAVAWIAWRAMRRYVA